MRNPRAGARHKGPRIPGLRAQDARRCADRPARTPRPSRARIAARGCSTREGGDPWLRRSAFQHRDIAGLCTDARTQYEVLRHRLAPELRIDAQIQVMIPLAALD